MYTYKFIIEGMERTFAALPGQNSKMSAVTALIRLQEVYLDRADFTNATGSASNHDNVLTGIAYCL